MSQRFVQLFCLAIILGAAGSAWSQLLMHYQFDSTSGSIAVDSSGKGNDGEIIVDADNDGTNDGDPNWVADGWLDGALSFDGTQYITLPAANLGLRSDAGAVSFWMYKPSLAGAINTIWWGGDNTTGGGFGPENEMHIHTEAVATNVWVGGELSFFGLNSPDNIQIHSDPNKGAAGNPPLDPVIVADAQWHHVVGTWGNEDGNAKLYLDGRLLTQAVQGTSSYALDHMYIGQMANRSRRYYGTLDEVQIYGRPLSADEVTLIMQGGLALTYPASLPSPADKITEVVRDAVLSWMPGDTFQTHNVYFGTSFEDVNAATTEDPRGVLVSQGQTGNTYDPPGLLDYNQKYYWRVDEVEADGTTIRRGVVWSFTALNFLVVDDFESYTDDDGSRIYQTWFDGYGTTNNGSQVGYIDPPYAEQTIIHKGLQSMPFFYDTDHKFSEAEMELTGTASDWTRDGVVDLSLWFRGYPLYVGSFVENPAGTYTMNGTGSDIWGTADQFHFAYKELTGATSIIAKVLSVSATHDYAKAGVMIRDSLDAGSTYAAVFVTPTQGVRFQYRNATDGTSTSEYAAGLVAPYWVRVDRTSGGLIRAYYSPDGSSTSWTQFTLKVPTMTGSVFAGMAVTSHDATLVCEGVFSNVTVTGTGSSGPWTDQDVGILSNSAERIYAVLNDNAVVYTEDPNTTLAETWTEWRIPLQEFAAQGVNLAQVNKIAIGVGSKGDTSTAGGTGRLYIDDIRLYRPSGE
jgi:hypothetical protein